MKNLTNCVAGLVLCMSLVIPTFGQEEEPDRRFTEWDRNNDGKLVRDELPAQLRRNFDRVDEASDLGRVKPSRHDPHDNPTDLEGDLDRDTFADASRRRVLGAGVPRCGSLLGPLRTGREIDGRGIPLPALAVRSRHGG